MKISIVFKALKNFLRGLIPGKKPVETLAKQGSEVEMPEIKEMRKFLLKRIHENSDSTFGVLIGNGDPICLTLENSCRNNQRNISAIPLGHYTCKRITSPRFGETFEVCDVPGRSNIIFHAGNTHIDTRGCILPGSEFGTVNGHTGVLSSAKAMRAFMAALSGVNEFYLKIAY